ncbi:MAG: ATP-binding protein [Bacteroidota bacterium]|nr:ATP-binding protein [Bacteroidota bacterium]
MIRKTVRLIILLTWFFLHRTDSFVWGQLPENNFYQNTKVKIEHLPMELGNVAGILQDRKGFMWFCTSNGLKKYDGYSFTTYKHNPNDSTTLFDNLLSTIWEDKEGTIWLGTSEGGLSKFDSYHDRFIHFRPTQLKNTSGKIGSVTAINEDSNGTLWLGHEGAKITRFNKKTGKFFPSDFSPLLVTPADTNLGIAQYISSIIKDKDGSLWISNNKVGIHRLNVTPGKESKDSELNFTHFRKNPVGTDPFSSYLIRNIYQDHAGMIWLCTANGLNQLNPATGKVKYYFHDPNKANSISHNDVLDVVEDQQGNLWIATLNGVNKLNKDRTEFTGYFHDPTNPGSLSSNDILSLYIDRTGILWVVTAAGLDKIYPDLKPFYLYRQNPCTTNSLSNNVVRCIWEDKSGIIWIGTLGGGLNAFNRKTGKFTHYRNDPKKAKSLPNDVVSSIMEDRDGNLWVATAKRMRGSLSILNRKTGEFTHYAGDSALYPSLGNYAIVHMYEDRQGIIWLCTTNGLSSFNRKTGVASHYQPDATNPDAISSGAYIIKEDRRGNLWVGTDDNALNKLDRKTGKFMHYKPDKETPGSISSGFVRSIYEDSLGILWFGTLGGGLCRFDPNNEIFTVFTEEKGLPGYSVYSIQPDNDGNLWLGTNNGLAKFNPFTLTFTNYDVNDGLQHNLFAIDVKDYGGSFKGKDGTLYFGGINGMNAFYPRHIQVNKQIPAVAITNFKLLDKLLPGKNESDQIQLSYKQNFFSFEFAALNYINTQKNQYAYKLEGVDKNWVFSGNRRYVSYTNLEPGEYVFKVKGSNNDGIWNEKGASIRLTILPPWWRTSLAYTLYVLLFVCITYGSYRYLLTKERLKQDLKLKELEAAKLHEVDQMKSRFFTNISHEFRTPLTLILSPVHQMLSQALEEKQVRKNHELIYSNAQRLLTLINQLLDLSKLEAGSMTLKLQRGDLVRKLRTLVYSFSSLAESQSITLSFYTSSEKIFTFFDYDKVEKIINNLLSNAFKFTPAGGSITVRVATPVSTVPSLIKEKINSDQAGDFVQIRVEDTGRGIPPELVTKIFERFYQVDSSSTREQEGTGIGLSLTKELVELHKGKIVVESELGKGTTFIIYLPLVDDLESALPETKSFTENPEKSEESFLEPKEPAGRQTTNLARNDLECPPEGSKKHGLKEKNKLPQLLVVEDNQDVATYIKDIFMEEYTVLEAKNGQEGLQLALEHIPDLVISDLMMPKMDGLELCTQLKALECTSHIPLILLTAKSTIENKLTGLEIGADEYITKPFHAKELVVRVKNLIEGRRKLREKYSRESNLLPAGTSSVDEKFFQKALSIIEANVSNPEFDVEVFSKEIGMSRMQLHRKLTALTNQSPGEFIRTFRLKRAAQLLDKNCGNISEIAFSLGFSSLTYFTKCFKEQYGQTPSDYLAQSSFTRHP